MAGEPCLRTMTLCLQASIEMVSTKDIDEAGSPFALSYPGGPGERLLASIERVGIIEPLILLQRESPVLVCGFRRLAAARLLGMEEVPARVLIGSDREALLTAIHGNLDRGHTTVEKALCLSKMDEMGCTHQEMLQTMVLLSLEPHEKVLATMTRLGRSTEVVKHFVALRSLSLKSIELLLNFEEPHRSAIADLLTGLRTTESLVREILELFLLMRARKVPIDVEQYRGIGAAGFLKAALKAVTSPMRAGLEQKLSALKAECRLPPGLDIRVDPFFEKEYIDILVHFRSESEGRALVEKLLQLFGKGHIEGILELTRS